MAKARYLVCYDYGQGAGFVYIYARSFEEIQQAHPELSLVENEERFFATQPDGRQYREQLERNLTFDIDEPPRGFLKALVEDRAARRRLGIGTPPKRD